MIIRESCIQDLPYIYDICLKTGDSGKDATSFYSDKYMLGSYYAAPYIIKSPSDCFVIVDSGFVSGYILCAKNTNDFYKWMNEKWLPNIRENYREGFTPKSENEKSMLETINKDCQLISSNWITDYPAHLHIDILKNLQGKGSGRKLMETLFSHLIDEKISGIHLGVSESNKNAQEFYKKMGFVVLEKEEWGLILGKKLI